MHGNVMEWVEDCWHDGYSGAPTDGQAWLDEENVGACSVRMRRGGGWDSYADFARSPYRLGLNPSGRDLSLGFRVVCSSPSSNTD